MLRRNLLLSACALTGAIAIPTAAHAKANFDIYGFAQADYIYDIKRVDPNWEDALRPSKIPVTKGIFGSDGQSIFSPKQSRFGVKGDIPVGGPFDDITFKFEFDLFGTGVDAGQTTMRIRHAYGEWGQVLAGQTNSLFMDGDIFPNIIEYWGPVGMAFVRKTQLRWTPWRDQNNSFAIAVEDPGNDIDVGTIRQFDPNLGANITNDEKWPDLTMAYRNQGDWGHFQLAGIFRNVRYETIGTVDHRPKGSEPGWGVDVSGHVNTWDRDKLLLGVVYGSGIASYMNDGGVDLAPEGAFPNAVRPKAVPSLGISAYYDHYWDQKWSTSLGYSLHQQDNANLQDPSAYKLGEYASINLLYAPVPKLTMGGELQWGQRKDFNQAAGDDIRFQFSVKYDFGVSVGL